VIAVAKSLVSDFASVCESLYPSPFAAASSSVQTELIINEAAVHSTAPHSAGLSARLRAATTSAQAPVVTIGRDTIELDALVQSLNALDWKEIAPSAPSPPPTSYGDATLSSATASHRSHHRHRHHYSTLHRLEAGGTLATLAASTAATAATASASPLPPPSVMPERLWTAEDEESAQTLHSLLQSAARFGPAPKPPAAVLNSSMVQRSNLRRQPLRSLYPSLSLSLSPNLLLVLHFYPFDSWREPKSSANPDLLPPNVCGGSLHHTTCHLFHRLSMCCVACVALYKTEPDIRSELLTAYHTQCAALLSPLSAAAFHSQILSLPKPPFVVRATFVACGVALGWPALTWRHITRAVLNVSMSAYAAAPPPLRAPPRSSGAGHSHSSGGGGGGSGTTPPLPALPALPSAAAAAGGMTSPTPQPPTASPASPSHPFLFAQSLQAFDPLSLHAVQVSDLRRLLKEASLTPAAVRRASPFAGAVLEWIVLALNCFESYHAQCARIVTPTPQT
jgi:hypothetical protein